eukprot:scpid81718/ scgid29553/ 
MLAFRHQHTDTPEPSIGHYTLHCPEKWNAPLNICRQFALKGKGAETTTNQLNLVRARQTTPLPLAPATPAHATDNFRPTQAAVSGEDGVTNTTQHEVNHSSTCS